MSLAKAELFFLALILVRAFYCLRTPPRNTYTNKEQSNDNVSSKA
jgi:hypothetical protein